MNTLPLTRSAHRVKSVEFAQPGSYNASRFGCGKRGCWTVQVGNAGEPLEAITSHTERESALRHAHAIPTEWDASFVAVHPKDAARFSVADSIAHARKMAADNGSRKMARSL